jgi:Family of unknown function (DUF5522)
MRDEPLTLGVDYYLEEGRWVFTAHYLKERGHCCENGCRHCPYGFLQDAAKEKEEPNET